MRSSLAAAALGLAAMLPAAALAQSAQSYGTAAPAAAPAATGEREFWIGTVHLDGRAHIAGDANHGREPYPTMALPAGGGIIRREPDAQGYWTMRAFLFQPTQVVVEEGDRVALHFVGVQGPSHVIALDGREERVEVKRGEVKTIRFVADKPGMVVFRSLERQPSMQGSVVVLPKR